MKGEAEALAAAIREADRERAARPPEPEVCPCGGLGVMGTLCGLCGHCYECCEGIQYHAPRGSVTPSCPPWKVNSPSFERFWRLTDKERYERFARHKVRVRTGNPDVLNARLVMIDGEAAGFIRPVVKPQPRQYRYVFTPNEHGVLLGLQKIHHYTLANTVSSVGVMLAEESESVA